MSRRIGYKAPLLGDGAIQPGEDSATKLTLMQESEPTPEEKEASCAAAAQRVRAIMAQVQALDPHWRPPDQLIGTDATIIHSTQTMLRIEGKRVGSSKRSASTRAIGKSSPIRYILSGMQPNTSGQTSMETAMSNQSM